MTLYQRYGKKLLSTNQDTSNPISILSQVGEVVTRLAHNQKIGGANPSPATKKIKWLVSNNWLIAGKRVIYYLKRLICKLWINKKHKVEIA